MQKVHELVEFACGQGYATDELVEMIENIAGPPHGRQGAFLHTRAADRVAREGLQSLPRSGAHTGAQDWKSLQIG